MLLARERKTVATVEPEVVRGAVRIVCEREPNVYYLWAIEDFECVASHRK